MASFQEMLDAGLFLIINTIAIFVFWVAGSPIIDFLSVYLASFTFTIPVVTRMAGYVQPAFGWFFWLLLILEVALFIRTYFMIATRVDYSGDSDF